MGNDKDFKVLSFHGTTHNYIFYIWHASLENRPKDLSLSYQKKDGHAWQRPSFFWYDTDFSEFDSAGIIDYILEKAVSYHMCQSFFWYDNDKDLMVCFLVTCDIEGALEMKFVEPIPEQRMLDTFYLKVPIILSDI